jgi:hypothetical protein
LIVKTARRSRAPNTWRDQLDWRRARPADAEREGRDLPDRNAARCGWPSTQADSGA